MTKSVGLIIQCDSDFFGRMMYGAQHRLEEADYVAIVGYANPAHQLSEIHKIADRGVDGFIIYPSDPNALEEGNGLNAVLERQVPIVTVNTMIEHTHNIDFVGTDDYLGGKLVAEHLLKLGHEHLAFWHPDGLDELPGGAPIFQRLEGFKQAIEVAGKHVYVDVFETAKEMLHHEPQPTAVFISNDMLVPMFCHDVATLGFRIPIDVSVAGFGDREIARYLHPPLTTVRQDPEEIGRKAADLLLARISGEENSEEPIRIRLAPELVERESTGGMGMILEE